MTTSVRTLIIGTGFSGISMAIHLQKAGFDDFLLLEKADEVGGTWRENTYPGAECDVPSALYSFSFEHNAEWRYKWSEQKQILDYLRKVTEKHGLYSRIRFGQEVASATWDAASQRWTVHSSQGQSYVCQFLITGVGQLHHPAIPTLPGAEQFAGPQFHSARWRHDVDLTGKRVAVIGNAASALQFIPQITKVAGQVTVFQRSANWVLPKMDRAYTRIEQWLSEKVPALTRAYRFRLWLFGEIFLFGIMKGNRLLRWWGERETRRYIARHISDPAQQRALLPTYPIGAKRVLFSDDYYAALARPNVHLVTSGIASITPAGVRCRDGREIAADVIVYGTGFRTNPFLSPMQINGRDGRLLSEQWRQGAQAYLGMSVHGFPNLFMMYGPNTNLGHNSIVVMIEAQSRYLVDCLRGLAARGASTLEVTAEAEAAFNQEMQNRLASMAWNQIEQSWYKDGGRITNNWAGSTWEYMRRCRQVDWSAYRVSSPG